MIVIKSPFRLSFVGEVQISKAFIVSPYCVISTSINKYIYINIHKKFEPDTA